jgi:methyl-accepting chemotaxis protein/methyl-accepting chemotaxis protein-1 (serine sensor receptor)
MVTDKRTIGEKLFAGVGVLLLLTVVEGGVAVWGSARVEADIAEVTQRSGELQRTLSIYTSLFKIESSVKSMLWAALDNDQQLYAAEKKTSLDEFAAASQAVDALATGMANGSGQEQAAELRRKLDEWKTLHGQIVEAADGARVAEALEMLRTRATPLFKAAEESAQAIANQMFKATDDATLSLSQSRSRTVTALVIFVALLVGGLVAWLVRSINASLRGMSRELGEGGQMVVEASSQMSASAQSMSQGAAEQAASLEETSASMEEIAAMTRTNAANSQQAATLMGEAARVLDQSNQSLSDMVGAMDSIKESSNRVSKIIKTIDEIAFQTNILALNAAVEAARAGEAGMGFAVVADEVRNLAQRSAQAARDTTALIEGAIASSNEGSQRVSDAAEAFTAITERVASVKQLVDSVSVASGEQAHGIDQVLQSIRQMEKVTQTTAATAEESAAASEQLSAQAGVTMRLVERLEDMVGRADRRSTGAPAPLQRPESARAPRLAVLQPAARQVRRPILADDARAFPADGTYGQF